jgi:hypothetical protein
LIALLELLIWVRKKAEGAARLLKWSEAAGRLFGAGEKVERKK